MMASSDEGKQSILVIGCNVRGGLGLGHRSNLYQLTLHTNKEISKVFSFNEYTIYSDAQYAKLFAAGNNSFGQCGTSTKEQSVDKLSSITFFNQNNIIINKICINSAGYSSFFISNQGKLYGCGKVPGYQNDFNFNTPTYLQLDNVIDTTAGSECCVAICSFVSQQISMIIHNWARSYSTPTDVISVIIMYTKSTKVYSTTNGFGSGHPTNHKLKNKYCWNEVEFFNDKDILKISAGYKHTLFLDDFGNVYSCGRFRDCWSSAVPEIIRYFVDNSVPIVDVCSGFGHNLALDENGKVYAWGNNSCGQCGNGDDEEDLMEPILIKDLMDYQVESIQCGYFNSCCKTVCGRYYLWGSNGYGQCTLYKGGSDRIMSPFRIDTVLKEKHNVKKIIDIDIGFNNTKINVELNE